MKTKLIPCLLLTFTASLVHADPVGTAFTYQGHLNANGSPANGSYDFIFTLYTNSTAGNQITSFPTSAVPVSNGLFTATVDLGNVFNGTAYWLGISVRTDGTGSYTQLSPRQPLTPTPYAVYANTASALSGTVTSAINFSGTLDGDVTGTQGATLVSSVGGETAANISNAVSTVNFATSANTAGAIVKRDANGNLSAGTLTLAGSLYFINSQNNTPIGLHALANDTSGSQNVANGNTALYFNTTGSANTASGWQALYSNTSGNWNVADGNNSLFSNTIGNGNVADGTSALYYNTSGNYNTASGNLAMLDNTSGSQNVAFGSGTLSQSRTGAQNTAVGYNALEDMTNGQNNIALGQGAGANITSGNNNIFIGNTGSDGDTGITRIGTPGVQQSASIAGIYNHAAASGVPVYIVSSGQLGTLPSSERFKQDIKNMGQSSDVLYSLKPVTFKYKSDIDPSCTPQFGLVAEQVEKVDPDLVVLDDVGKTYTVRYQAVNAMLLNEFLKEHKKVQEQSAEIQQLKQSLSELREEVSELVVAKGGAQ